MKSKQITPMILVEETPRTLAENLYAIEQELELLEAAKDSLRQKLLLDLKKQGVRSVKLNDGTYYLRAERSSLQVKNKAKAQAWFLESPEYRMKPNTFAALSAMKQDKTLSKVFTKTVTEFLTIRRPNEKEV